MDLEAEVSTLKNQHREMETVMKDLKDQLHEIKHSMANFEQQINALLKLATENQESLVEVRTVMDRLVIKVDGDPDLRVEGLQKNVETLMKAYEVAKKYWLVALIVGSVFALFFKVILWGYQAYSTIRGIK